MSTIRLLIRARSTKEATLYCNTRGILGVQDERYEGRYNLVSCSVEDDFLGITGRKIREWGAAVGKEYTPSNWGALAAFTFENEEGGP